MQSPCHPASVSIALWGQCFGCFQPRPTSVKIWGPRRDGPCALRRGLQAPLLFCRETGQGCWAGGDWGSEHLPQSKVTWGLWRASLKSWPGEALRGHSSHWPLVCCLVEWAACEVVLGPEGRVAFLSPWSASLCSALSAHRLVVSA